MKYISRPFCGRAIGGANRSRRRSSPLYNSYLIPIPLDIEAGLTVAVMYSFLPRLFVFNPVCSRLIIGALSRGMREFDVVVWNEDKEDEGG